MAKVSVEALARLSPLGNLSGERLAELAAYCRLESLAPGQALPRQRLEAGLSLYLLQGELRLSFADGSGAVLQAGSEAAAWPLGLQEPRPQALVAVGNVELLGVDGQLLDILLTWEQLAANAGVQKAPAVAPAAPEETTDWRQMSGAFNVQVLTASALGQLPPAHIDVLLQRFRRLRVPAGEVLIREGDVGDAYYLIESGSCEVTRRLGNKEVVLAQLGAGQAFGEEALVANARRNASVTMKSKGVLLKLGKEDFDALLRAPLLKGLSRDEAQDRVARGAVWVDVRYPAEFRFDGLPGAINLPVNEVRGAFGSLDPNREYVVYCQSGRRSSAVAFLLTRQGYQAWWLEGGLWGPLAETKEQ